MDIIDDSIVINLLHPLGVTPGEQNQIETCDLNSLIDVVVSPIGSGHRHIFFLDDLKSFLNRSLLLQIDLVDKYIDSNQYVQWECILPTRSCKSCPGSIPNITRTYDVIVSYTISINNTKLY